MNYFFDLYDGHEHIPDNEGLVLPSERVARQEAISTLAEMAKERAPSAGQVRSLRMRVRDEVGFCFECSLQMTSRECL